MTNNNNLDALFADAELLPNQSLEHRKNRRWQKIHRSVLGCVDISA